MKALITCPFGLSSILWKEIKKLNIPILESSSTFVIVETDIAGIYQLNLRSRIANKVYVVLWETKVHDFDQLFKTVSDIQREQRLPDDNISLNVVSKDSVLFATKSIQSVAHKAILNRLKLASAGHKIQSEIFLHLEKDNLRICLNTSGHSLHERGWRTQTWPAPLKENLAAGIVLLSWWRFKSSLRDPFCWSGTILIEAVMIARNIAPWLQRSFAFQNFINYNQDVRDNLKKEAKKTEFSWKYTLLWSDTDQKVLEYARQNAINAGVWDSIKFMHLSFSEQKSNIIKHWWRLISNPPYGKRLDSNKDLSSLYLEISEVLVHSNMYGWIISSYPDFSSFLDSYTFSNKNLYNGSDEVSFWRKKPV